MRYEVVEPNSNPDEQIDSESKPAEMPLACKHRF